MKNDHRIDELETQVRELQRRIEQLIGKIETWGTRLSNVENFVVAKRSEERKRRILEDEMWTKSTK